MKILLIQTDIRWQAPEENRLRAQELIAAAPAADLIVLPEMFTTGFATDPTGAAEPADSDTLKWMQTLANAQNAAVAGSIATEEEGKYYNRFYFVKPDGSFTVYNKRHLFTFAGEDKHYEAGGERVIVEWRGWRILLQICYDLRFPVFSRNRGNYDLVLYVANWPTVRIHPWNTLLRARAIENMCYVAGVNRTGEDPFVAYSGGTALIDFKGDTAAEAAWNMEEAVFCELDKSALDEFREKFPALDDADEFRLI